MVEVFASWEGSAHEFLEARVQDTCAVLGAAGKNTNKQICSSKKTHHWQTIFPLRVAFFFAEIVLSDQIHPGSSPRLIVLGGKLLSGFVVFVQSGFVQRLNERPVRHP